MTFTGTPCFLDAWFGVLLATVGPDWYQALLVAALLEVPAATARFGIAIRQLRQSHRHRDGIP